MWKISAMTCNSKPSFQCYFSARGVWFQLRRVSWQECLLVICLFVSSAPVDLLGRYRPNPLHSQHHTVTQTQKGKHKWETFISSCSTDFSTRGIIPTIHALSQYISPTAYHIYPLLSCPLRKAVGCVCVLSWDWSTAALCVLNCPPGDIYIDISLS